jgi:hypothetical protein
MAGRWRSISADMNMTGGVSKPENAIFQQKKNSLKILGGCTILLPRALSRNRNFHNQKTQVEYN